MKIAVTFDESLQQFVVRTGLSLNAAYAIWAPGLDALHAEWKSRPAPVFTKVKKPVDGDGRTSV